MKKKRRSTVRKRLEDEGNLDKSKTTIGLSIFLLIYHLKGKTLLESYSDIIDVTTT